MNSNEVEIVDQDEELFNFLQEICSRYHLGKRNSNLDEKDLLDWIVVQAGLLYIKYVLQPEGGNC